MMESEKKLDLGHDLLSHPIYSFLNQMTQYAADLLQTHSLYRNYNHVQKWTKTSWKHIMGML